MTSESKTMSTSPRTKIIFASLLISLGGVGVGITSARAFPELMDSRWALLLGVVTLLCIVIGNTLNQSRLK
jgi:hypothetical protein